MRTGVRTWIGTVRTRILRARTAGPSSRFLVKRPSRSGHAPAGSITAGGAKRALARWCLAGWLRETLRGRTGWRGPLKQGR